MNSIVVIEDEFSIRMFVTANLEVRGYTVYQAETGTKGLDLLKQVRPSVLILDVLLPDITGWDVLMQMNRDENLKDIPVIMMTASVGVNQPNIIYPNLLEKMVKPVGVDDILTAVSRILESK